MSHRYEWTDANADVRLVPGGGVVGQDSVEAGAYALILGDPNGTALVVTGTDGELRMWADSVPNAVRMIPRPPT
ncbi:MAG: hypothetical protein L0H64_15365 [Pseudonocardia sp.]|nr:hypothetical protein [Pseudonocardia sp.]